MRQAEQNHVTFQRAVWDTNIVIGNPIQLGQDFIMK